VNERRLEAVLARRLREVAAERRLPLAIPVVDPKHLAAIKMAAGRGSHRLDLEYLITSGELDEDEAEKIIKKYLGLFAADEFGRIAARAKWNAGRGR